MTTNKQFVVRSYSCRKEPRGAVSLWFFSVCLPILWGHLYSATCSWAASSSSLSRVMMEMYLS